MPLPQLGQRFQRLVKEVVPPRLGLQRQETISSSARPARISRISCCVRVKSVKPSTTTSRSLVAPRGTPFGQHVAGRPETALGVVQTVFAERLLIGLVDFPQFVVFVRHAAGGASVEKFLGPDFQPLQFADELAHQIDQAAGRRRSAGSAAIVRRRPARR